MISEDLWLAVTEQGFAVLDVFFTAYCSPVQVAGSPIQQRAVPPALLQGRILPQLLAASKSSNALARSSTALLFNTIVLSLAAGSDQAEILMALTQEIGTPLRTNKTASPEQRVTLCQMMESLRSVGQSQVAVLIEISECLSASLAKETNDAALKASLQLLCDTVRTLVLKDVDCSKTLGALLVKGMTDGKANVRRHYLGAVGDLWWALATQLRTSTSAVDTIRQATVPGFENALKNASNGAVGSAVEGWIAVASLVGSSGSGATATLSHTSRTTLASLLSAGVKPSFLLAEKGYRKLANPDDEIWLVRALQSMLLDETNAARVVNDSSLHTAVTLPLLQIAVDSQHHAHRAVARQAVKNIQLKHQHGLLTSTFIDGLDAWLQAAEKQDILKATTEEVIMPDRPVRLRAFLACVAAAGEADEQSLIETLVISHHPLLAAKGTPLWVDIILKAGRDPQSLASSHATALLEQIWQGVVHLATSMRLAANRSIATLVLIAPEVFLEPLAARINALLAVEKYAFIGETEMGIFSTPEGQTFVDGESPPQIAVIGSYTHCVQY